MAYFILPKRLTEGRMQGLPFCRATEMAVTMSLNFHHSRYGMPYTEE